MKFGIEPQWNNDQKTGIIEFDDGRSIIVKYSACDLLETTIDYKVPKNGKIDWLSQVKWLAQRSLNQFYNEVVQEHISSEVFQNKIKEAAEIEVVDNIQHEDIDVLKITLKETKDYYIISFYWYIDSKEGH